MKSITRLMSVCAITIAIVSMTSCKKGDTGPAGPAGPAGAAGAAGPAGAAGIAGPAGKSGNANVMLYIFGNFNSDGSVASQLDFTDPTANQLLLPLDAPNDTLDRCAWFAYLSDIASDGSTISVALPGFGLDNVSNYSFISGYDATTADQADFFITRVAGAGEKYDMVKLVRILLNDPTATTSTGGSGRHGLPDIDFKDFNAVKKYYNLTDPITLKSKSK